MFVLLLQIALCPSRPFAGRPRAQEAPNAPPLSPIAAGHYKDPPDAQREPGCGARPQRTTPPLRAEARRVFDGC